MEDFIMICGSVLVFLIVVGVPFGYAAYVRRLKHLEMEKMIEKGLVEAPSFKQNGNGKGALRWGIVMAFVGFALSLGLYPFGFLMEDNPFPLYFGPWMVIGLLPMFFGLSLLVIHKVLEDQEKKKEGDVEEE